MTREIEHNGKLYQFRYIIIGSITIKEGIGIYIKEDDKWIHVDDIEYINIEDMNEKELKTILNKTI